MKSLLVVFTAAVVSLPDCFPLPTVPTLATYDKHRPEDLSLTSSPPSLASSPSLADQPSLRLSCQSSPTWLQAVPGARRLHELSLPGSHDTMAWQALAGNPWVYTQHLSLKEQLEVGVRFLDIRLKLEGGRLNCYHGLWYLKSDLTFVMEEITGFLARNTAETVVFRFKNEAGGAAPDGFCARLNEIVRAYPIWNREENNIDQGSSYPTLDEMRGNIVILNHDQLPGCFGFRFSWKMLDNYSGEGRHPLDGGRALAPLLGAARQGRGAEEQKNSTMVEAAKIHLVLELINSSGDEQIRELQRLDSKTRKTEEEKERFLSLITAVLAAHSPSESYKKELEEFLDSARTGYNDSMMIAYSSASALRCHPHCFASHVNPRLESYLRGRPGGRTGVVVLDFITSWNCDIPKLIYQRNL